MERPARSLAGGAPGVVVVVSLLIVFWGGAAAAWTVRVGVMLDLASDAGRENLACISTALDDFHRQHAAAPVELQVRDSGGEVVAAAHAAQDLIKNGQVQGIISGIDIVLGGSGSTVPVLSLATISPAASCAFWLQDPAAASRSGHGKIGFTLGNESITFLDPGSDRRNARELMPGESCVDPATPLTIAVPLKQGFQAFLNVSHPYTTAQTISGYSIDVFETAMMNLQEHPCYNFSVFNGTYDELVGNVSSGVFYGAVGDVTITSERVNTADFIMPYPQSGVSMLVLAENEPAAIQWTFVKPLTTELWLATVVFFFYTAFVVWMIERSRNHEYQGPVIRQFSTASYFAFSTLTFSHGQIIRSPLSRIVVVIWCFVVLILVQSYTASLSSILTAKRLRPSVTDLNQLRLGGDFVGYQDQSFVRSILIHHHGIRKDRLRSYSNKDEYADALKKGSKNGGVSAIVDEVPYLTSFLSDHRYQRDFKMVGSIYKTPGFGFVFGLGSPLVHNLSAAILNITEGPVGSKIEEKWFGASSQSTLPDAESTPLTLQGFSGLFIITGSISTLMMLVSVVRTTLHAQCTDNTGDQDDLLRGENTSDEEATPGPAPAEAVQIEMPAARDEVDPPAPAMQD